MSFCGNVFVRVMVDSWQSFTCLKQNIGRYIAGGGKRGKEKDNAELKDGEIKVFKNKIHLILI